LLGVGFEPLLDRPIDADVDAFHEIQPSLVCPTITRMSDSNKGAMWLRIPP
jgi:hypothetical protein